MPRPLSSSNDIKIIHMKRVAAPPRRIESGSVPIKISPTAITIMTTTAEAITIHSRKN